jgi:general secretion pathway protein A
MYEEYFGLKKKPFSIVPDPGYFFMSHGHREALAHLMYGITNEGGFVLLTGEVGAGKTTVCRRFLELLPEDVDVAFILNPKVTAEELLANICDEFRIAYPDDTASVKNFVTRINSYLLDLHEKGRKAVLIIEEAQNLKPEVLEQIRLLTNLETKQRKLLQMIMLGQPELRDMLAQPQFRQLSQRITARYHLGPLTKSETPAYVDYRLSVAGLARSRPFPPRTAKRLFQLTGGVPRLINVVCDRALLGAYVMGREQVDVKILARAAREVSGEKGFHARRSFPRAALVVTLFIALCVGFAGAYYAQKMWPSWRGALLARVERNDISGNPSEGAGETPPDWSGSSGGHMVSTNEDGLSCPPGLDGAKTREQAMGTLFREWRAVVDPKGADDFTAQARSQGLRVLSGVGSIGDLRYMNKPAVLGLKDEKGATYYGTLTSLKGDRAVVAIGEEAKTADIKELTRCWTGEYLLLWREPPGYKENVRLGETGPTVGWIEERLALAQGKALPANRVQRYDRHLEQQVKQFQTVNGMVPDGIVGPRTLVGLGGIVVGGDPSLSLEQGGR